MSADNRICIMKCGEPDFPYWAVWHGSCSQNYFEAPFDAHQFENERDMNQYVDLLAETIGFLEGGITIVGREEQICGLNDIIFFAQQKLKSLEETGEKINAIIPN